MPDDTIPTLSFPATLAARDIQLWVAEADLESPFHPILGELRCRLALRREHPPGNHLGSGDWRRQGAGGLASVTLEAEGRSCHDQAECLLQTGLIQGTPRRLRLQIGGQHWLEGQFFLLRYDLDAPLEEAARFTLEAESQGAPMLTPLV